MARRRRLRVQQTTSARTHEQAGDSPQETCWSNNNVAALVGHGIKGSQASEGAVSPAALACAGFHNVLVRGYVSIVPYIFCLRYQ